MPKRIFLIALLSGLASTAAAYYPLYRWLLGQFISDWPPAEALLAMTGLALILVICVLSGAFAARQSGARSPWSATGAGALTGLLTTWIMEAGLGDAAAGVWGARLLIEHGLHATQDEAAFISLLVDGVSSIIWSIYLSIWVLGGLGALLGALGGWAAGPGGNPLQPKTPFGRFSWLLRHC